MPSDKIDLPEQKTIDELRDFVERLSDAAASVTLKYFRQKISIDDKVKNGVFDPVTEGDRGAEAAIRALIDTHYPDHAIIGEEYGIKDGDSDFTWVLDPIDGTRAFISGLPTWGTLIALLYKGEPIIGVIDQPYLKERYVGMPGSATLNGDKLETRQCPTLADATISTTDPDLFKGTEREAFNRVLNGSKLVRYGLDCYAYAIVASGHMDLVIENGLESYDMMALIPVIRGAGGAVTNWQSDRPGASGHLLAVGDSALIPEVEALLK
ncbi:histidinol-phosphatase [Kordiimonas sp. SCSIO 12610]|uniref:histidinol-phosphatase n=1 Tax=Kordiimonas sp. SCSIO 12610 TaxID=2829597 RepID=UPI00210E8FEA|nr:histidinol-phosphatase [Kordiimonas sp. SCSIO 12610]UTW56015.1 histidinol-phosphatase [Kordiimonas sp. SCSIO 12610]